jgi:hypothetical protein
MNKIGIIITSIFFIVSCAKQEGEGGIASIEGIMMVQKVNLCLNLLVSHIEQKIRYIYHMVPAHCKVMMPILLGR